MAATFGRRVVAGVRGGEFQELPLLPCNLSHRLCGFFLTILFFLIFYAAPRIQGMRMFGTGAGGGGSSVSRVTHCYVFGCYSSFLP